MFSICQARTRQIHSGICWEFGGGAINQGDRQWFENFRGSHSNSNIIQTPISILFLILVLIKKGDQESMNVVGGGTRPAHGTTTWK
jgi:hypothetical protein